jgi:hypothetical protein
MKYLESLLLFLSAISIIKSLEFIVLNIFEIVLSSKNYTLKQITSIVSNLTAAYSLFYLVENNKFNFFLAIISIVLYYSYANFSYRIFLNKISNEEIYENEIDIRTSDFLCLSLTFIIMIVSLISNLISDDFSFYQLIIPNSFDVFFKSLYETLAKYKYILSGFSAIAFFYVVSKLNKSYS